MVVAVPLVQFDIGCFDGEFAFVWHGIPHIDRKVHDYLLNLRGIDFDETNPRPEQRDHVDVLSQEPAKHFLDVGHRSVQVEDSRLEDLPAAECQQLAR
jgi:hypothetical protein